MASYAPEQCRASSASWNLGDFNQAFHGQAVQERQMPFGAPGLSRCVRRHSWADTNDFLVQPGGSSRRASKRTLSAQAAEEDDAPRCYSSTESAEAFFEPVEETMRQIEMMQEAPEGLARKAGEHYACSVTYDLPAFVNKGLARTAGEHYTCHTTADVPAFVTEASTLQTYSSGAPAAPFSGGHHWPAFGNAFNAQNISAGQGKAAPESEPAVLKALRAAPSEVTTLMIQNVPPSLPREDFLLALDNSGFTDLYNFCHMPRTFKTGKNQGVAFVNFVSQDVAERFVAEWHGDRSHLGTKSCCKAVRVNIANIQGLEACKRILKSKKMQRVKTDTFKPVVLGA